MQRRQRAASGARSRRGCDGVADLDDAQVLQPVAQVRQALERLAAQTLGIERREQAGRADDVLDRPCARIEGGDQQRVEAGGLAQRFEVLAHQRVGVLAGEILEIDRGLGEQDVEARLRLARAWPACDAKQRFAAAQRGIAPALLGWLG